MHVFFIDQESLFAHFSTELMNESDVDCGTSCETSADLDNWDCFALTGEWVVVDGVKDRRRGVQGSKKRTIKLLGNFKSYAEKKDSNPAVFLSRDLIHRLLDCLEVVDDLCLGAVDDELHVRDG